MFKSNFGIILSNFIYDFSPQTGGIKYVCLVHACDLPAALQSNIKSLYGDASDLVLVLGQRVDCGHYTVDLFGFSRAKIEAACKLTHDKHIKAL